MKRLFDIVASGLGLILLSPLFLVLAIWIKVDSEGPVFYRQIRVGRYNRDFRIFKFRSMRAGSDTGSLITIGGRDPRITRSGYFIRKFKFDEYYIEVIMQEKIKLYLQYVEKQSFLYDITLIFKTFWMIVTRESE